MELINNYELLTAACEPVTIFNDFGKVDPNNQEKINTTVTKLKEILNKHSNLLALSAPQIGIKERIFCIKFDNEIKTFINPIIKKRSPEKFVSFEQDIIESNHIIVLRPTEIEIVYFTDELKMEDNKLLGQAAALFTQQYNLLDGIVPGKLMVDIINLAEITLDDIPAIVDATYSGSGIILTPEDTIPELEQAAEVLADLADNLFMAKLKEIMAADDEPELQKAAKVMWAQERVILGYTKIVDEAGYEQAKKQQRQVNMLNNSVKKAKYRDYCGKVS